jgi:hypothetical protein
MPSLRTAVSIGETGHAPFKPQVTHISPLGRTVSKACGLPGGKNLAESTQSKGANNKEISSSLIWLICWTILQPARNQLARGELWPAGDCIRQL